VKRDSDGLPVSFDPEIDPLASRLVIWRPTTGPVELSRALTDVETSAVAARATALELALMPHDQDEREAVESALAAMFSGFRQMRQTGESVEATVAIARMVLREFPAWAIQEACLKIARGQAGIDRRWPPNDAQLCELVSSLLFRRKRALDDARLLLSACVGREQSRVGQ
jgi:hypothetical protein